MSNPTFKPSEGKREEFRKYLEKNGVMDALTKVLVNLYEEPEKPVDALEYIRDRLAMQAGLETYNQMRAKIEENQARIDELYQELVDLKAAKQSVALSEKQAEAPPEGEFQAGSDDVPPEEVQPAEEIPAEEQPPENPE